MVRRQNRSDVAAVEDVVRPGRDEAGRVLMPQLDLVLILNTARNELSFHKWGFTDQLSLSWTLVETPQMSRLMSHMLLLVSPG